MGRSSPGLICVRILCLKSNFRSVVRPEVPGVAGRSRQVPRVDWPTVPLARGPRSMLPSRGQGVAAGALREGAKGRAGGSWAGPQQPLGRVPPSASTHRKKLALQSIRPIDCFKLRISELRWYILLPPLQLPRPTVPPQLGMLHVSLELIRLILESF